MERKNKLVIPFKEISLSDVPLVGGKNASLGEMVRSLSKKGIRVPDGFAVTASAYRNFLDVAGLTEVIKSELKGLNTKNLKDLARRANNIRTAIRTAEFPQEIFDAIELGYRNLESQYGKDIDVAVRSSATAEDLPGASFAGEHETYLNIRGVSGVVNAVRSAMASLFTDRAISYRVDKGFDHLKVALSVGVQCMVRSDLGASGVMFTIDTESGFRDTVVINGAWGLGELIVQGEVTPDEYRIFKPFIGKTKTSVIGKKLGTKTRKMIYGLGSGVKRIKLAPTSLRERTSFVLSDLEAQQLAGWGAAIERHYSNLRKTWTPMDIEWAKDGKTGELFIVQARPETFHAGRDYSIVTEYVLKGSGSVVVHGASVGSRISTGRVRTILDVKGISSFKPGEVLVTDMTDPDWEPIMKVAAAIVTDKGGRTSHAAIVSRELGIPCIVGTENATKKLKTGDTVTVDTTGNEGYVYRGSIPFDVRTHRTDNLPKTPFKVMVNIATPESAFEKSFLPVQGVGLAREEFIIASQIGIHPMALIEFSKLKRDPRARRTVRAIEERTAGYHDKTEYYVERLAYGIASIAAAFYPKPVILRFSDFKTNEYRTLLGGDRYEPQEENPMLGWRGASRYYDPKFKAAFGLECKAIAHVRDHMGFTNVIPMVPFCRTPDEGKKVINTMREFGLDRSRDLAHRGPQSALKVYVMCEIPSNVILADEFLDIFDGMSIGSNDLTQLTLGLDRDSGIVSKISNENDAAVKALIKQIVPICRAKGKYLGICGQAPSDYPEFAAFLAQQKIESVSLNPDTVIKTIIALGKNR